MLWSNPGWYVAYCHLPNYNNPKGLDYVEANQYLITAKKTLNNMKVSEDERVIHSYFFVSKLIETLTHKVIGDENDNFVSNNKITNKQILNAFAIGMQ